MNFTKDPETLHSVIYVNYVGSPRSITFSNVLSLHQDTMEMCSKEIEFKSILFSIVYFHAVLIERRKFGPQGWNRSYPFNTGDLTISVHVLYNYLEANPKVSAMP